MEKPSSGICAYCQVEQLLNFKFCSNCGKRNLEITAMEQVAEKRFQINLRMLSVYALFSLCLLVISALSDASFESLIVWSLAFSLIDIVFGLFQPSVFKLMQLEKIRMVPLLSIILICIGSGILVSFSSDHLNLLFFEETSEIMDLFVHLEYPLLVAILLVAVFPAVFEELAFRGFVFNNLKVLGGEQSAIWGSAFLFALVHLSLLSLIWIFPFGLLLGYFRKKYATLVYGMAGHFVHNSVVILIEYYELF